MSFNPEDFVWVQELGSGWFGTVNKVIGLKNGHSFAIKKIDLDSTKGKRRVSSLTNSF